jgi:pantothenate synthetase
MVANPEKLTDMERIDRPCLLALAVRVGNTRLIDNVILREN